MFRKHLRLIGLTTALATLSPWLSAQEDVSAEVVAQSTNGVNLDIDSLHANVHVDLIGDTVTVYRNSSTTKLYMLPVLLADWSAFRTDVERLEDESTVARAVPLHLTLHDRRIAQAVLEGAKKAADDEQVADRLGPEDLSIVPHSFFRIEARIGGRTDILATSTSIEDLRAGINTISSTRVPSQMTVLVRGTKRELREFLRDAGSPGTLVGKLYSSGHAVETSVLAARARAFMESAGNRKLFGDEKFERSRTVTSSGGGAGFNVNLGFASFGGGSSRATTETTQSEQRVLSRSYISEQVAKNRWALEIVQTGEVPDGAVALVTEWVIGQGRETRLQFQRTEEQEWTIGNGEIGYARLSDMQVNEVLKAGRGIGTTLNSTDALKDASGRSVSRDRKSDFTFHNDIEWSFDGESWVPTSVDLLIVSEQQMRESIDLIWSRNIVSKERSAYVQEFVTPLSLHRELATRAGPLREALARRRDEIAHIEAFLGKLTRELGVKYSVDARAVGFSEASDGDYTEFKGDGKTPDRIRVWLQNVHRFDPLSHSE